MRTLIFGAICALPIVTLFFVASRSLDEAQQKPKPAAIRFTAGSAKQLLETQQGYCIPAVLRDPNKVPENRGR